jgi:hypothetical protein
MIILDAKEHEEIFRSDSDVECRKLMVEHLMLGSSSTAPQPSGMGLKWIER